MKNLWSISGNLCKKTKRMKKILVFMLTFVLAATASAQVHFHFSLEPSPHRFSDFQSQI